MPGQVTAIECLRSGLRDLLERSGQRRVFHRGPYRQRFARGIVEQRLRLGAAGARIATFGQRAVEPGIDPKAVARQRNRGGEQFCPGQLAMFRVCLRSEREIPGYADAESAADRIPEGRNFAVLVEEPVRGRASRCGLASVVARHRAIGRAADHEPATADARTLRFDNRQREHHGDRRVGGTAALA